MKSLSNNERKLLELYNKMSDDDKIRIMERAETLYDQTEAARKRKEEERIAAEQHKKAISFPVAEQNEEYVEIPLYDTCVSAGTGIDIDYTTSEPFRVSSDYDDTNFAVRVSGNSMEPRYHNGDIVIVEPTPAIKQGEIGIFILNGQAYIKKLGDACLISLNEEYEPIKINAYDSIYCQGKVINVISAGKKL